MPRSPVPRVVTLMTVMTLATLATLALTSLVAGSPVGAGTRPTARSTTTVETVPGIPQGPGRAAPVNADGGLPSTGTTLPAGPVRVRLTALAVASQPVGVVARPGDAALYVIEKTGRIRVVREGRLDPTAVLDLSGRVSAVNENGLLGLAFPAGPETDRPAVLYVLYNAADRTLTLSEIPFDGTVADPARERVLLALPKTTDEHNAGTLVATADGLLWVAVGDGGPAGDPRNNAQRLDRLMGKVLRIDPRGRTGALPYAIPADNPYVRRTATLGAPSGAANRAEVWAYGLRNPWRLSVDEPTGDVWIPDVGESSFEEINRVPAGGAGANLGWRMREGTAAYKGGRPRGALDPVYAYPHKDGRCAVVGGAVYRGRAMPALQGAYVFGDVCTGRINALVADGGRWRVVSLGARLGYLTSFGTGPDGELYATSLEGGVVQLVPAT